MNPVITDDGLALHLRVWPAGNPRRGVAVLVHGLGEHIPDRYDHVAQRLIAAQPGVSWIDRLRAWAAPVFNPFFGVVRQPRFAMSFGMAFFSVTMALNVAGIKLADLRHIDLRPSAISRGYHMTQGRVVKYYENIRFVYQIESKVSEIKRVTTPAEPAPSRDQHRRENNNTSGQPEQRQERNYSQGENTPVLAFTPDAPPVVTLTAIRRFV